jgi:hypothetical protein
MRAGQCNPETINRIVESDVVFMLVGGWLAEQLVRRLNPRAQSLQHFYRSRRNRRAAYTGMVDAILAAVRAGHHVCVVVYGHPGVFVTPTHEAVRLARAEGYGAEMLPAISAEDCLYADLGVDPGIGVQSYEARDFYLHARAIDTSAALILWQIAVTDDASFEALSTGHSTLRHLTEALGEHYPPHHEVVVYEAATLVTSRPRITRLALQDLPSAKVSQVSTLFVRPLTQPRLREERRRGVQSAG